MIEAIKETDSRPVKAVTGAIESGALASHSNNVRKDIDLMNGRSSEIIQENIKESRKTEKARINRIAEALESYIRSVKRELNIQVHDETGNIMVRVISQEDGKVIREIPSKEILDLAAKLDEMTGMLLNASA